MSSSLLLKQAIAKFAHKNASYIRGSLKSVFIPFLKNKNIFILTAYELIGLR
jgi:hypothetical protein